jgi:hypothetical protein
MKIKEITEAQMAGQYKIVKTGPEGTTLQSPDMHTQLMLDPEATKGIVANPDNPNQFTLSPQVAQGTTSQQPGQQGGIKQGATVEIPTTEGHGDNFEYQFETEIDDQEGNPVRVSIEYNIYGEERPETWGYHGGEPAEHPEIDAVKVTNLDTGEDITDQVDVEDVIWDDFEHQSQSAADDVSDYNLDFDENVGGDPTDDFIDDVRDKEFEKFNESGDLDRIRKLSGL